MAPRCVTSICGLCAREVPALGSSEEFVQVPSRSTPTRICENAETSSVQSSRSDAV